MRHFAFEVEYVMNINKIDSPFGGNQGTFFIESKYFPTVYDCKEIVKKDTVWKLQESSIFRIIISMIREIEP